VFGRDASVQRSESLDGRQKTATTAAECNLFIFFFFFIYHYAYARFVIIMVITMQCAGAV